MINRPVERRRAHASGNIEDTDVLRTMNALLDDEKGEEAKPWTEELEKTKILTVLADREEMMKGR